MKKYQIIGFILWTLGNIILTMRMWDYILIAPVLAVQVAIWICCSTLFCVDISSRGLFIAINTIDDSIFPSNTCILSGGGACPSGFYGNGRRLDIHCIDEIFSSHCKLHFSCDFER